MTHLPECWLSEGKFDGMCICDRLRACEQRVLNAAREAVAGLDSSGVIYEADALAAIDALREKPLASGGIYAGPPIPLGDGCVIPKSDAIDALKEKP